MCQPSFNSKSYNKNNTSGTEQTKTRRKHIKNRFYRFKYMFNKINKVNPHRNTPYSNNLFIITANIVNIAPIAKTPTNSEGSILTVS